jgi:hypothetical protein
LDLHLRFHDLHFLGLQAKQIGQIVFHEDVGSDGVGTDDHAAVLRGFEDALRLASMRATGPFTSTSELHDRFVYTSSLIATQWNQGFVGFAIWHQECMMPISLTHFIYAR